MILTNPDLTSQSIKFIPREYGADELELIDEQTGDSTLLPVTTTQDDYYDSVLVNYTFTEGRYYVLKVRKLGAIVYRDKIFSSNQGVDYSINDNEYQTTQHDNDFIIYE